MRVNHLPGSARFAIWERVDLVTDLATSVTLCHAINNVVRCFWASDHDAVRSFDPHNSSFRMSRAGLSCDKSGTTSPGLYNDHGAVRWLPSRTDFAASAICHNDHVEQMHKQLGRPLHLRDFDFLGLDSQLSFTADRNIMDATEWYMRSSAKRWSGHHDSSADHIHDDPARILLAE